MPAQAPLQEHSTQHASLETAPNWVAALLRTLLILAVADSDRSNLVFGTALGPLKDLVMICSLLALLREEGWQLNSNFILKTPYGLFLLYILLSFPTTLYSSMVPYGAITNRGYSFSWAFYIRPIYFILLVHLLTSYFRRYPAELVKLISLFCSACVGFVAFNLIAYFYHFPFMSVFRPYLGRISNGYPTSDALMLCMAIVGYCFILYRGRKLDYFLLGVLSFGVVANFTASGFICFGALAAYFFATQVRKKPIRALLVLAAILVVTAVLAYAGYLFLSVYSPLTVERIYEIYQWKSTEIWTILDGGTIGAQGVQGGTFAIRLEEYTDRIKFAETTFDRIFGLGTFYSYVEIQYLHVLIAWGFIGLGLFLSTLAQNIVSALNENREQAVYFCLIWATAGGVLITTYLFPLFVPYAILAAATFATPLKDAAESARVLSITRENSSLGRAASAIQ